jgi:hypothetical protein
MCSSERLERIRDDVRDEPDADVLTDYVAPPQPDPPNMRCLDCGHTWWLAPEAPPINPDIEGVAD